MDHETLLILGNYDLSADRLADHFLKKHGLPPLGEDAEWTLCDRTDLLCVAGQYLIDLSVMREDLMRDAPVGEFENWYAAYRADTPAQHVNYRSYLMGFGRGKAKED